MSNRVIVIPDVHVPLHDRKAWATTLKVISDTKPKRVVSIGDFGDFESVSLHARKSGTRRDFRTEKAAVRKAVRELQQAAGSAELDFLQGNHEERLERYLVERAPEMEGDEDLSPRSVLGLRDRDNWTPYRSGIHIGKVYYTHDVGHAGKNSTQQTLDSVGQCVVTGHTHRAGLLYGGDVLGEHSFSMTVGWLGDKKMFALKPYMPVAKMKDWQLAFGIVDYDADWNLGFAQLCAFVKGRVSVDGRSFK